MGNYPPSMGNGEKHGEAWVITHQAWVMVRMRISQNVYG